MPQRALPWSSMHTDTWLLLRKTLRQCHPSRGCWQPHPSRLLAASPFEVAGSLTLREVAGSLTLREVAGSLTLREASGSLTLHGLPLSGLQTGDRVPTAPRYDFLRREIINTRFRSLKPTTTHPFVTTPPPFPEARGSLCQQQLCEDQVNKQQKTVFRCCSIKDSIENALIHGNHRQQQVYQKNYAVAAKPQSSKCQTRLRK